MLLDNFDFVRSEKDTTVYMRMFSFLQRCKLKDLCEGIQIKIYINNKEICKNVNSGRIQALGCSR